MRPSTYSQEIADAICDRMIEGKSLAEIVREDPDMPAYRTVFGWLDRHPEFSRNYARAREAQADALADEILEAARREPGKVVVESETGCRTSVDSGEVQNRRLLIDALKWRAGKMAPKKYGDTTQIEQQVTVRSYVARLPEQSKTVDAWSERVAPLLERKPDAPEEDEA